MSDTKTDVAAMIVQAREKIAAANLLPIPFIADEWDYDEHGNPPRAAFRSSALPGDEVNGALDCTRDQLAVIVFAVNHLAALTDALEGSLAREAMLHESLVNLQNAATLHAVLIGADCDKDSDPDLHAAVREAMLAIGKTDAAEWLATRLAEAEQHGREQMAQSMIEAARISSADIGVEMKDALLKLIDENRKQGKP